MARRLRTWTKRIPVALCILLALIGIGVGILVGTDWGTRHALREGVDRYSARIPGSIGFDELSGSLSDRLCIDDVHLEDARGRPLLTVARACVRVDLSSALGGDLIFEHVDAARPVVHLYPDKTWKDLAPPRPERPRSDLPGPNLPLRIAGAVSARDFSLVQHRDDGATTLVSHAGLLAHVDGEGRGAHARVEQLWGHLDIGKTTVGAGRARIEWSSPSVTVSDLDALSSRGVVLNLHGTLDTLAKRYQVELIAAGAPPGVTIDQPQAAVATAIGAGTWSWAAGSLTARSKAYGATTAVLGAGWDGGLAVAGLVTADPPAPTSNLAPLPSASALATTREGRADALVIAADAIVAGRLRGETVYADASIPGAQAAAHLSLTQDTTIERASGSLTVVSGRRATEALDDLLPWAIPTVPGRGDVHLDCTVSPDRRCRVDLAVRRDEHQARATAVVQYDGSTIVALRTFEGALGGLPLRLQHPTRILADSDRIEIEDLSLSVAGGSIRGDGVVGLQRPSDLRIEFDRIRLRSLSAAMPVPRQLAGTLRGRATLTGPPHAPSANASLRLAEIRVGEERLGRLSVSSSLHRGRFAVVDARWTHEKTHGLATVRLPVRVDLGAPRVALRRRGRGLLRVELDALPLERIDRGQSAWSGDRGELLGLRGRLDATIRAAGPIDRPTLVAHATATHLELRDRDIGNVEATVGFRDRLAHAFVDVAGDAAQNVALRASVPLSVSLTAGEIRLRVTDDLHVSAEVGDLELGDLQPWVDRSMRGTVTAHLSASPKGERLRAHASVLGHELVVDDQVVGTASLEAVIDERDLAARAVVSNPDARAAEALARLPVRLDSELGGSPSWTADADGDVVARAELNEVRLGALGPLVPAELAGVTDATLLLEGSPRRPKISGHVTIEGLAYAGRPLGELEARALYDDEAAKLRLEQTQEDESIRAKATIPIALRLDPDALGSSQRTIRWNADRRHELALDAVGMDRALLEAFVDTPLRGDLLAHADVRLAGSMRDLSGRGRLRATLSNEDEVPVAFSARARWQHDRQQAHVFVGGTGPTGLTVDVETGIDAEALVRGEREILDEPVVVTANASDFPLRSLEGVLPNVVHDPAGQLDLHASLEGTLAEPQLRGTIEVHDGAITVVPLNQRLTDLQARGAFEGPDVRLAELRAESGDGTVSARGQLHIAPQDTRGSVRIDAEKLPIVRPGLPLMRLDTGVNVDVDATGDMTAVEVALTDPFLDVIETAIIDNPHRLPAEDGIAYVDAQGRRRAAKDTENDSEPWVPRSFVIDIDLADPLRVRGPQADMEWVGEIEVMRPAGGAVKPTGSFRAMGGRVTLLDNDFDLERAEIRLPEDPNGTPDPYIDLIAVTQTPEASVTMVVRGRVSRPELELRSDPPMPQSDILALLITGRSSASAADDESYDAKAASVLAAFQNPALQRYLRDRVGVDRVGVGFGQTVEQPIVTVGKRINRKLYAEAEYHHNAQEDENQAEASLEYTFLPHWSVETRFGDAAAGGVTLWWTRRFEAIQDDRGGDDEPSKQASRQARRSNRRPPERPQSLAWATGPSSPAPTLQTSRPRASRKRAPDPETEPVRPTSIEGELTWLDARYDDLSADARTQRDDDLQRMKRNRRDLDGRIDAQQ